MSQDTLLVIMTVAVSLSAIAMVAMACMIFGMWKSIRAVQVRVEGFMPQAESFLQATQVAFAEHQGQLRDITSRTSDILDLTQKQLLRVDDALGDAVGRAKVQMERLELVLDDTVNRVHGTVVQINNTVVKPVREINALGTGLRTAVQAFLRGQKPSVAQATADEEMFI